MSSCGEPVVISYPNTPFSIKAERISDPKAWTKCRVHIYQNDQKIGEYERNYSFMDTFYPFGFNSISGQL
jgi:hypothetical protein